MSNRSGRDPRAVLSRRAASPKGPQGPHPGDEAEDDRLTTGQRAADLVARHMGSWRFIVVQATALLVWIALNSVAWINGWDTYPFILLNLVLSFQAAFAAPVIMMSQNRQAARDRLVAAEDYAVDCRAAEEIAAIHARLDELSGRQWAAMVALQREQLELLRRIDEVGGRSTG